MEREIEVVKNKPNDYPCKGCTDRHAGCHAECEGYLEARERNIVKKAEARKDIEKEYDYLRFRFQSIARAKKRRGTPPND